MDIYKRQGIRHTIISFEPFFLRREIRSMSDARIGQKFGIPTKTVKAMRMNRDVPFDTIRAVCHELECQPGDIMKAITAEYFPAAKDTFDQDKRDFRK